MKSSLPTVTVILYKSKTLANGEHPIMLRLCHNGQRKYKSLGLSCSEKMWNEKKEVKDYYEINVARSKTNKPVRILVEQITILPFLLPFTEAIKNVPDDEVDDMYVFPIYSEQDDTTEKKFGRMTYANYLVNVNLKRIAERLGMKPITFYSARHTYASALYHANVPMGLIAQNMGRNPAEIETYLKDFDRDSVIDANQHLYVTSTDAYKEGKEARLERRRAERQDQERDDASKE